MPKLTILAACERVIVDKEASLPSLINIFQRMNVQLQDAPLPENAVSPTRWSVFTLWQHIPEERGVEYTQRIEVISPSGDKFVEASTAFKITEADDLQTKNHIDIFGIPINAEGFLKIRVWLEGIADTTGEYQFLVKYLPKIKPPEPAADKILAAEK
ncbi:MAG: hypothetical protein WBQ94_02415 [Terracidiphilus sp.]